MLGVIGWLDFYDKSKYWKRHKQMMKVFLIVFWTLNLMMLPLVSAMYSKKSRVESMYYLSKYPSLKCILLEDIYKDQPDMPPKFYIGQWPVVINISNTYTVDSVRAKLDKWGPSWNPRFVLFFDEEKIDQRVNSVKTILPQLTYETTIMPSFIDDILFHMNPRNTNQTIVIYRNKEFFPNKIE
jgi:hypothetical protein